MKILTFICVLVVSVSVYAKTEAGLNVQGFGKKTSQRNLAAAAVSDMGAVLVQLGNLNKPSAAKSVTRENMGFSGNVGALTKPRKKSAAPVKAADTK